MKKLVSPMSVLAAVIAAVAISACGGSSNTSSRGAATVTVVHTVSTGTKPSTTTATTNTTKTATQATQTATRTTAQSSGPPPCVAADLKAKFLGSNGAAGTIYYGFALQNTSGHECHTYGYPGAAFLSSSGAVLPTPVKRRSLNLAGPVGVSVRPGHEVSFVVGAVGDAYKGGSECKSAAYLQIIAPNDTTRMRVALPNGAQACGEATVSQVLPGRAAFAG